MEPWHRVVTPRKEVREGRSFNPDEFAIALEQVVTGNGPVDYCDPKQFFARTCFTKTLTEHTGMVLKRLAGETRNTPPVLTLITQFGGGKTHTLTTLYHLAKAGKSAGRFDGVSAVLSCAGLTEVPQARVAVLVGNAWDPQDGRETPWIDIARQLAGDKGVELLGKAAKSSPPGTDTLRAVYAAANAPVLVLFDEVLNLVSRHRKLAEPFLAFIQNLTVSMTGAKGCAALISLPRSKVEMTDSDQEWQDKLSKVVKRVSKDLIVNDEAEVGEVIRRRLFEDLGDERVRRKVAKAYADWCFEHRAQLPRELTQVDATATDRGGREFLQARFESCYPFHPSTLSVFQRKWQVLQQYQQTRGTLAMLAQWVSIASRHDFKLARKEPLVTLGSAPLEAGEFRAVVLGQLGEPRLESAIVTDISGQTAIARSLDADTKGALMDIHRRAATVVLFESSGGQKDKAAVLPELRFALGSPDVDTTSVDVAALAFEAKAYYMQRVGTDGFRFRFQPTLKKVVNDRRASLDYETEIRPLMREYVKKEFAVGATIPVEPFPQSSEAIADSPRLSIVLADPETEWTEKNPPRTQVAAWSKKRGASSRLYPAALVWCLKKEGRELREHVEQIVAWRRVQQEVSQGVHGDEFSSDEKREIIARVKEAEGAAKDEVWASYRFAVVTDPGEKDGLRVIDLGAGHSSAGETLCGRVLMALKSAGLLNESVGAGYLERHWPPAFKQSGAWPLASLRQSFLNGSLPRLIDPDKTLRARIPEFVEKGEAGLASGLTAPDLYGRIWFRELLDPAEVVFDADVYLLRKDKAESLKGRAHVLPPLNPPQPPQPPPQPPPKPGPGAKTRTVRLVGDVPYEAWNRLGTRVLPKLKPGTEVRLGVNLSAMFNTKDAAEVVAELQQVIEDLKLAGKIRIE